MTEKEGGELQQEEGGETKISIQPTPSDEIAEALEIRKAIIEGDGDDDDPPGKNLAIGIHARRAR